MSNLRSGGPTLSQQRELVTSIPGPASRAAFARRGQHVAAGVGTTLPVFIFSQYSTSTPVGYQRAWGGALVLIVLVMVLNLTARLIGRVFAPAKGH